LRFLSSDYEQSSGLQQYIVVQRQLDILDEHTASNIKVQEQTKQETSRRSLSPASADFPLGLNSEDGGNMFLQKH
jgi:hypothetical protein